MFPQEIRPNPVDQDSVTLEEHSHAVRRLKLFLSEDSSQIEYSDHLALKTAGLGREIKRVIIANGKVEKNNVFLVDGEEKRLIAISRLWTIREKRNSHIVFATFDENRVFISNYTTENKSVTTLFDVELPFGSFAPKNEKYVHGLDLRVSPTEEYFPLSNGGLEVARGYFRLLQNGVTELLSVIPPDPEIPEVFLGI